MADPREDSAHFPERVGESRKIRGKAFGEGNYRMRTQIKDLLNSEKLSLDEKYAIAGAHYDLSNAIEQVIIKSIIHKDKYSKEKLEKIYEILLPHLCKLSTPQQRGMKIRFREIIFEILMRPARKEWEKSKSQERVIKAIKEAASKADFYKNHTKPYRDAYEFILKNWTPQRTVRSLAIKQFLEQLEEEGIIAGDNNARDWLAAANKLPLSQIRGKSKKTKN